MRRVILFSVSVKAGKVIINMPDLFIHLQPSYRLVAILSLAHLIAASFLWPLALPLEVKAIIVVLLIISLLYYLRKDALLSADDAVIALQLKEDMCCIVTTRSGQSITCRILGSTFVAPYLTVMNLQPAGKFFMRSVVILPDSIKGDEFRRLRVWLRWKWKQDQETGQ